MFLGILVILPEFFRNLKGLGRIPLDLQGFARYSWDLGRFLWIWIFFLVFGKVFLRFGRICKVFGWFGKIFFGFGKIWKGGEGFGSFSGDLERISLDLEGGQFWCTRGVGYWWVIGARFPCFSSNFMKTVQKFHQDFRTPKNGFPTPSFHQRIDFQHQKK